jgi:transposase
MEDVLELYEEPFDPLKPLVCFDERPCQLISEKRSPLPARSQKSQRYDCEYKREGTCNLFAFFQPLAGWRHIKVTEQRTARDFAYCMKELVDELFPHAESIRVVLDNLNTHTQTALYQTFPPQEARRILNQIEFHYTPKHGSWLNMVEIEFSVLSRQCLKQRIPDMERMKQEVGLWEKRRNRERATVEWRFTNQDARVKLERLYPELDLS